MDNQHKKIKGYRDLSQCEIDLINELKSMGNKIQATINTVKHQETTDQRWINIAETHLQQGIMAAVRSVAKPDSF